MYIGLVDRARYRRYGPDTTVALVKANGDIIHMLVGPNRAETEQMARDWMRLIQEGKVTV